MTDDVPVYHTVFAGRLLSVPCEAIARGAVYTSAPLKARVILYTRIATPFYGGLLDSIRVCMLKKDTGFFLRREEDLSTCGLFFEGIDRLKTLLNRELETKPAAAPAATVPDVTPGEPRDFATTAACIAYKVAHELISQPSHQLSACERFAALLSVLYAVDCTKLGREIDKLGKFDDKRVEYKRVLLRAAVEAMAQHPDRASLTANPEVVDQLFDVLGEL